MGKIYLMAKAEAEALETPYLTCYTGAATADKTVSKSGFELKKGSMIYVRFNYANTASNLTLNVNDTGAKTIYGLYPSDIVQYGVYGFVYDGSYWQLIKT